MPVDMNGYWKMISNDNFEEYMKALGNNLPRAFMYSSKLSLEIIFQYPFISTGILAVFQDRYHSFFVIDCRATSISPHTASPEQPSLRQHAHLQQRHEPISN
ncbi:hypothetical protein DPEC_G00377710 [Dallia pectoralis]|nr:hypothetical protein DPEC_G00377710 [Dallia pectoralis]